MGVKSCELNFPEANDMWNKPMLSLEQAQNAIAAMIADYNRDPDRRKVDMAVVDDAGNLLAYARMDGCLRPTFAIRKAYTSASPFHGYRRLRGAAQ